MKIIPKSYSILIVDSERATAEAIKSQLLQWGYRVVGIAGCCRKAKQLYQEKKPHMTLIDTRLGDCGPGIELAHFIRTQVKPGLFIYLGPRPNDREIQLVRETFPAAYLPKPIQPELLYANLEIAFYRHATHQQQKPGISLSEGNATYFLPYHQILYLEADHIYVKINTTEGQTFVRRGSLSDLLDQLPANQFVKTHRSFAVNVRQLNRWDKQYVYVSGQAVPLSRGRRKDVIALLEGVAAKA